MSEWRGLHNPDWHNPQANGRSAICRSFYCYSCSEHDPCPCCLKAERDRAAAALAERDRAAAARVSSWGLWFLSLIGMGAAFDGIADRDWPMVVALTLVTLLLALAAGHERQEMREASAQADLLDGSWMDEWAGAWR